LPPEQVLQFAIVVHTEEVEYHREAKMRRQRRADDFILKFMEEKFNSFDLI
jgi:hypothetical protein